MKYIKYVDKVEVNIDDSRFILRDLREVIERSGNLKLIVYVEEGGLNTRRELTDVITFDNVYSSGYCYASSRSKGTLKYSSVKHLENILKDLAKKYVPKSKSGYSEVELHASGMHPISIICVND